MTDPWRLDQPMAACPDPPDPLPPRLARLAALTESVVMPDDWTSIEREELPEVAALMERGWRYLDDDPRYALLPAIWPLELRCWLPDRRPKMVTTFDGVNPARVMPAALARPTTHREHEIQEAADAGFPPPPTDRIWFLRPPWPFIGLKMLLWLIDRRVQETTDQWDQGTYTRVAADMLQWEEARLRAWWTGEHAETSKAWESQGRIGEDAVELVCVAIGPPDRLRLVGLTDGQVVTWCHSVGLTGPAAVERILAWRSLGFPAEAPADLYRLRDLSVEEIRPWLAAGFSIPEMIETHGMPLAQAISWRTLGFSATRVRRFLNADDTITAEEVEAFQRSGVTEPRLTEWIEYGFAAADAAAYIDLGVQPNEARVWRSRGRGPADVSPGQTLPPGYERGGWVAPAGTPMRDVEHFVPDPPGTRGCKAARAREHTGRRRPQ